LQDTAWLALLYMVIIAGYDKEVDSLKSLSSKVNNCYKRCVVFFGREADVKIFFCYSRHDFDTFAKKKTPNWMVGISGHKEILIFSPSVFEKVSSHPMSDFVPVLTHEIAHVFVNQIYEFKYPVWLSEGICGYIAGQDRTRKVSKESIKRLALIHDAKGWGKAYNYSQAFLFTSYLIETFGKRKLFRLLKELGKRDSFSVFSRRFKRVYGLSPERSKKEWLLGMQEKTE